MTMRSWIRNLLARRVTRPIRKAPPRFRLALEVLEDRWVPSTFVVNNATDTIVAGLTDLRQAITSANSTPGANTVAFDATVFASPQTITLSGTQLELSNTSGTETITGPAAGVKVNAGGLSRVFQVDTLVTASISGLTITGGNFVGDGSFGAGGGGINNSGSLAMTNCTVSGNQAAGLHGGGGGTGAGVNNSGSLAMTNCSISGNTVVGGGGGVFNKSGSLAMTNCTASGNSAFGGGGIYNRDGTATLTSCTVSGNSALGGGGLYCVGGTITVGNTIVAGNTGGFGVPDLDTFLNGVFISQGNNLIGVTDGTSGWIGSDRTGTNALPLNAELAPLGNYGGPTQTMPPLYGSPAINAGNNALIPAGITIDQRGDPRIFGGTVDIGAYELQVVIVPSFVVNTTADYSDPTDGQTSLREAIASANAVPGHTITFDSTVFNTLKTITLTGAPLELGNTSGTETLIGPAAGVKINGGALSGAFQTDDLTGVFQVDELVTASISGLTITGGYSARYSGGAGVHNSGSLTMTNCTVSGNFANNSTEAGGGVLNSGSLEMTNCTVSGNEAIYGGGVENSGTLALTNCTVSGNVGYFGGGGVDNSGALAMTNCTVSGNSARYFGGGGGVRNSGGMTMTNSIVSGNSASYYSGGGGVNNSGSLAMTNCTVSGNSAVNNGGGVNNFGSLALTNCTVSGNSALAGGGLSNDNGTMATLTNCTVSGNSAVTGGGIFNQGTLSIGNTIVALNTASTSGPDALGTMASLGHNLIGKIDGSSGCVSSDLTGTISHPLNPQLAPLGNYGGPTQTMYLLPGSPAINAGSNALLPAGVTTDQRGLPRIANGVVDIGAVESQGSGAMVFGNALYLIGGNTNDQLNITPIGTSQTGSTGIRVTGRLNNSNLNNTYTQAFTTIYVIGFGGNDNFQFAGNLAIATVISDGDGNDNVQLGSGTNAVTVGNGNDNIRGGNGNNSVIAGNGNDNVQLGNGTNSVTLGGGNDNVQLGNGSGDRVSILGNGNDNVQVGNGNDDYVSITGNGNDNIQVGNGNDDYVSILGNGNDNVQTGNGTGQLLIRGTGHHNLHLGSGWMQI